MAKLSKVNANKLRYDIEKEIKRLFKTEIEGQIKQQDLLKVGVAACNRMLELIARGISPIEGKGRFAEYKWAGNLKAIKKQLGAKNSKKIAKAIKSSKYPYSAMKKYPNKKVRPVNLQLSGEFLNDLQPRVQGKELTIGYHGKSALKESGHREGVNGQPSRPTIPIRNEKLNASVFKTILITLDSIFKQKFRS